MSRGEFTRIVVVRPSDALERGWLQQNITPARRRLKPLIEVTGVALDDSVFPIPIYAVAAAPARERSGSRTQIRRSAFRIEAYAVVARFQNREAIERLLRDRGQQIVGVYADPSLRRCARFTCPADSVGTYSDVISLLGIEGLTGKGVRIAVVDGGMDGRLSGPHDSLRPSIDKYKIKSPCDHAYEPGSRGNDFHGAFVAFDCLLGAPDTKLLDCKLFCEDEPKLPALAHDALAIFAQLTNLRKTDPQKPLVVNNSWEADARDDAPVGSPDNYGANPNHPLNLATGALVAAGADVIFAAGNCGAECHDWPCTADDTGPGKSIRGVNAHPDAMTVAAVTIQRVRLGYSSQGPGLLSASKPDFAAYSHFRGDLITHDGTSASAGVATGVVAALRERWPDVPPAAMKATIQKTCDSADGSWNYDLGFGVVDPARAIKSLKRP